MTIVAERYRQAISSSDLRVRERVQGDSDLLIAAGWTRELGTMLYRLAAEHDQIKGDVLKTAADDHTGALLILMHLKSLSGTREAVARFAVEMATKRRLMLPDKTVMAIAGISEVAEVMSPLSSIDMGRSFPLGCCGDTHRIGLDRPAHSATGCH